MRVMSMMFALILVMLMLMLVLMLMIMHMVMLVLVMMIMVMMGTVGAVSFALLFLLLPGLAAEVYNFYGTICPRT